MSNVRIDKMANELGIGYAKLKDIIETNGITILEIYKYSAVGGRPPLAIYESDYDTVRFLVKAIQNLDEKVPTEDVVDTLSQLKELGITQNRAADLCHINKSLMSQYANNKRQMKRAQYLKLAALLGSLEAKQ